MPIGNITLRRLDPVPFSDAQIRQLETFADQAVIAIENSRLFQELEERNAALTQALDEQTATAEVLRVIASAPTDVETVLQAILDGAARLCDAPGGLLNQRRESDGRLAPRVSTGVIRERHAALHHDPFLESPGLPVTPDSGSGQALVERRTVHTLDVAEAVKEQHPGNREMQALLGYRTGLAVPLLRGDQAIGVISLIRLEVRAFTEQQIALLETFADQAVIAI